MKRRVIAITILICATFLTMTAIQYTTHAQESTEQEADTGDRPARPGRGERSGGRSGRGANPAQMALRMLPLEAFWAQLSLNMDIDDEALVKARVIYKEAWKDRKGMIKAMTDAGGDREAMRGIRSTVEDIQAKMATKLQDALTSEEVKKFTVYEKTYRAEQRSSRGGGGRPGGGGGGR